MPRILLYILLIGIFAGCKQRTDANSYQAPALYSKPLIVPLNLTEGYKVNLLTGNAIMPLVNSLGNVIPTGVPFSIAGTKVDRQGFAATAIIKDYAKEKINITTNVHPVKGKLEIVPAIPVTLSSIAVSATTDSIIIDKYNHLLISKTKINVTSKLIALQEPQPVKIDPMRYKDNATLDLQYLDIEQGLAYS